MARRRYVKAKSRKCLLVGGPYDGETVYKATGGTLPISVGRFRGYYDAQDRWIDLPTTTTERNRR